MQLKKIFEAAQGKPPAEQADVVCALAQGDEELESAVRDLLAADESAGSFLQTPAADLHSALLAPGTRLGPYQILGLLGEGGMGKVYRGLDTRLGRAVAIKISAEQFGKRFELEARAISALNHPNICTLYDVGPNYLVTELVEGETLRDWLEHTPALERRLETMRQVLEALRTAHCAGIVHRDLKPQNIMVRFDGYVKVLDFGLAKQLPTARSAPRETLAPSDASVPGQIVGTVAYMSPEQIQGHPSRSAQRLIRRRDHSLRDVDRATPLAACIDGGYAPCHPSRRPAASTRHDPLGCAAGPHRAQASLQKSGGAVFARRRSSGSAQQLRGAATVFGLDPNSRTSGRVQNMEEDMEEMDFCLRDFPAALSCCRGVSILFPQQKSAYGKRYCRACGFRQLDWRPGVRRHAAARHDRAA